MSWNLISLGEITNIRTGKLDANASSANGEYPFFTCAREPLKISSFSYNCECVLVAGNGDLNVKYYNGKFDAYQRTYIIESKSKEVLDVRYLFHFLDKYLVKLREQSIGGIIKYIKLGNLTEAKIPLPPLAEQRRIASILDQADELRQKRQQAIEKLDQLLQATFIDMFGDPVSNPKKWKMLKLGELTNKIQSGNTPKGGADNYIEKGITFIRSQNVLKNQMSLDDVVYISQKIHSQMKNSSLKHGDLLITKTGRINTENSSLGRAAIYLGEDDCANLNGHVYLMRLKENLNRIFILSIITSDSYYKYIRSVCVGVDKYQLNKEHLENFPIIQPPMELQNKFSDIIQMIESQKPKLLEQLELAEDLFKSLQNQAFRETL
ncbi:restriction endonuclease subunit S [Acinetobacter baumannii]